MGYLPSFIYSDLQKTKSVIFIIILLIVSGLIISGYINTINTHIRKLNLTINKKTVGNQNLHLVAVSDIHLSTVINKNRVSYLVKKINSLKPDIIILAGDILDEVMNPVLKYNIGDILKNLKAPLGIYAITGNHEYIGGIKNASKYITDHNIILLRDTSVLIDNRFWIVGREDRDKERFTGFRRKSIAELLENVDKTYPVILVDHQPFNLDETAKHGIDLQISGHTHRGQFWPFSLLTKKIYELDWGYKKKEETHFYVSCGFGTWGPPLRIGSRSEIVDINIKFGSN